MVRAWALRPAWPLVWGEPVAGVGGPPVHLGFLCSAPFLWPQVVMKVVQLLPDGYCVKKEVDAALDTVSETMTPMHYHLREIIICTYRQVSPSLHPAHSRGPLCCEGWGSLGTLMGSRPLPHLLEAEVIPELEARPA